MCTKIFTILHRFQCCPIYQVKYIRSARSIANPSFSVFNVATQTLPPIAWIPTQSSYAMPIQNHELSKSAKNWPFFAVDIFNSMGVDPPTDEDLSNVEVDNVSDINTQQITLDDNLAQLINLGFNDEKRNREILAKFNNDIAQTVNYFLDDQEANVQVVPTSTATVPTSTATVPTSTATVPSATNSSTSSVPNPPSVASTSQVATMASTSKDSEEKPNRRQSIVTIDLVDDDTDEEVTFKCEQALESDLPADIAEWALEYDAKDQTQLEDCPICCNDFESYETAPSLWQLLNCSHKLCLTCYSKILTTRSTMSNVQHTFVKCPFCQSITGIEVGTCPDMQMNVTIIPNPCNGYEPSTTLSIHYVGHNFKRIAFLPNNIAGQEILQLLKIAFDRRLCFTVGTSNTTGHNNVIVWNIHHKTSLQGGVMSHGYPDPGYIDRLKWELKAFGIE